LFLNKEVPLNFISDRIRLGGGLHSLLRN